MNSMFGTDPPAVLLLTAPAVGTEAQSAGPSAAPRVTFACEHGAAKRVIAAAYFDKMLAERGLPDRATYRGASPQAELSVLVLEGLKDDGLTPPSARPAPTTPADVTAAAHIFAIGCSLPAHTPLRAGRRTAGTKRTASTWSRLPSHDRYPAADLFPALLGHRTGGRVSGRVQGRPRPVRDTEDHGGEALRRESL